MPPALALVALAFTVGIAVRETLLVPVGACAAMTVVASILLMLAWRRRRLVGIAALASAVTLGALAASGAWPRAPQGLLDGEPWEVRGRVVEAPERGPDDTRILVA